MLNFINRKKIFSSFNSLFRRKYCTFCHSSFPESMWGLVWVLNELLIYLSGGDYKLSVWGNSTDLSLRQIPLTFLTNITRYGKIIEVALFRGVSKDCVLLYTSIPYLLSRCFLFFPSTRVACVESGKTDALANANRLLNTWMITIWWWFLEFLWLVNILLNSFSEGAYIPWKFLCSRWSKHQAYSAFWICLG